MTILAWFLRVFIRCYFPGYGHTDYQPHPTLAEVRDTYCGKP